MGGRLVVLWVGDTMVQFCRRPLCVVLPVLWVQSAELGAAYALRHHCHEAAGCWCRADVRRCLIVAGETAVASTAEADDAGIIDTAAIRAGAVQVLPAAAAAGTADHAHIRLSSKALLGRIALNAE